MKKLVFLIATLLYFLPQTYAQMTLANNFGGNGWNEIQVVNLTNSGKKIAVVRGQIYATGPDTIHYYNLDYSLWKTIVCPNIPHFYGEFCLNRNYVNISYSSETLFNLDTLLEAAIFYRDSTNIQHGKILIINENGTIVDSILNTIPLTFKVHNINPTTYIATVTTTTSTLALNLPGTIPCDACGGGLGLTKTETDKNLISAPIPNPSKDEVKISFSLPEGASRGELNIYNTNGQKVRSYQVDNRFGFIMVDNSQLASGTYYYNITSNGTVTSSQKMLVIR